MADDKPVILRNPYVPVAAIVMVVLFLSGAMAWVDNRIAVHAEQPHTKAASKEQLQGGLDNFTKFLVDFKEYRGEIDAHLNAMETELRLIREGLIAKKIMEPAK
jgi:hypothetical protein